MQVVVASVTIRNGSRDAVLADRAEVASGMVRRGLGLIGRVGWPSSDGLVLERCNSIHSFFMRMPIDVLYIDRENRVVRALPAMPPWRIGPISPSTRWVLELPAGTLARTGTMVGDHLELVAG